MDYLRTGKDIDYGIRRSYVNFSSLLSVVPYGATVNTAQIRILRDSGSGNINLKASRVTSSWDSNTLTWNLANPSGNPNYTTTSEGTGTLEQNASYYYYSMYVTYWVQQFRSGAATNYGFCIRDQVENNTNVWATWRSSDYNLDQTGPVLIVDYNGGASSHGCKPYYATVSNGINCQGYAFWTHNWPMAWYYPIENYCLSSTNTIEQKLDKVKVALEINWLPSAFPGGKWENVTNSGGVNATLTSNQWLVCLRVGYKAVNGVNEFDAHFWYKTNTGQWAHKLSGGGASELLGTDTPNTSSSNGWKNFGITGFYDSSIYYYRLTM